MDTKEYEEKHATVLNIPYKNRYRLLKAEKERLKEIEMPVPEDYRDRIKKRLQPNKCFEESIKFARDYPDVIYCIGQFQRNGFIHAWIEFEDQDYCFDGPLQAFYPKDKYYEHRKLKKLYTRTVAEITQLANTYEMYGLYPEDYQKLDCKDYNQKLVQEVLFHFLH